MPRLRPISTAACVLALLSLVACDRNADSPTSPISRVSHGITADPGDAVLFLRFDGSMTDESVYDHPVIYYGARPEYVSGCSDLAVMFHGGDFSEVPYDASLEPAELTLEVWMSPKRALADASGFNPLVVKYSGNFWNTVDGYDMWYQDSGSGGRVGFGIGTENGTVRKSASLTTTLFSSRLYHLVGTFDGRFARLYVNGQLAAQTPYNQPLAYLGGPILIGGGVYHSYYSYTSLQYYHGIIDQVAIFPRAMSADEILSRYNSCNQSFLNEGAGSANKGGDVTSTP